MSTNWTDLSLDWYSNDMNKAFPFVDSTIRSSTIALFNFVLVSFIVWIDRVVLLQYIEQYVSFNAYQSVVQLTKIIGWILPVYVYVRWIERDSFFTSLGLVQNVRQGLIWGIGLGAIHSVVIWLLSLVMPGSSVLNELTVWSVISLVFLAGITEEIVFRGLVLTRLTTLYNFWIANVASSFLFVLMHIPLWWRIDYSPGTFDLVSLFALGIIWGWVVRRSNSLWAAIIAHSLYNLALILLQ